MANDYQLLVERITDEFVTMVEELLETIAPAGPWWTMQSTKEERVLQWLDIREPSIQWLQQMKMAGAPIPDSRPLGDQFAFAFTDQACADIAVAYRLVPPEGIRRLFRFAGLKQAAEFINNAEKNAPPLARLLLRRMQAAPQEPPERLPQAQLIGLAAGEVPS
jgi:hypothetical protein